MIVLNTTVILKSSEWSANFVCLFGCVTADLQQLDPAKELLLEHSVWHEAGGSSEHHFCNKFSRPYCLIPVQAVVEYRVQHKSSWHSDSKKKRIIINIILSNRRHVVACAPFSPVHSPLPSLPLYTREWQEEEGQEVAIPPAFHSVPNSRPSQFI